MKTKVYLKREKKSVPIAISDKNKPALTEQIITNWQNQVNMLAKMMQVRAVLIMKVKTGVMEVAVKSSNPKNPYQLNGQSYLGHGMYCETVMGNDELLLIRDVSKDETWANDKSGLFEARSYLGVPIKWPDDSFYGTLCVIDDKPIVLDDDHIEAFNQLARLFNQDLKILMQEKRLAALSEIPADHVYSRPEFLRDISLEFKAPLTTIIGLSQMGANLSKEKTLQAYFDQIASAGSYLLEIVDEVKDIARIETNLVEPVEQNVNIDDFAREIESLFALKFKEKHQEFAVSINNLNPKTYNFDKTAMKRIIVNILENANMYTRENGTINWRISKSTQDGQEFLVHQITDNGVGIAPELMEKIFRPFPKKTSAAYDKRDSLGLGLSITYSLTKFLDGEIQVSSQKGEGSSFVIRIPVKQGLKIVNTPNEAVVNPKYVNKTVLLVEDNNINAMTIRLMLNKQKIKVDWVVNGALALENMKNKQYDLVLMDLDMPVVNGYEATRLIRGNSDKKVSATPIIAIASSAYVEEVEKSLAAGMDDHLVKPLDSKQLEYALNRYL